MSSVLMGASQIRFLKDIGGLSLHQIYADPIHILRTKPILETGSPWYPVPRAWDKTEQLRTRQQEVKDLGYKKQQQRF